MFPICGLGTPKRGGAEAGEAGGTFPQAHRHEEGQRSFASNRRDRLSRWEYDRKRERTAGAGFERTASMGARKDRLAAYTWRGRRS